MSALHVGSSKGETKAAPDFSWSGLYRAGSVCAALYVVLILVALAPSVCFA